MKDLKHTMYMIWQELNPTQTKDVFEHLWKNAGGPVHMGHALARYLWIYQIPENKYTMRLRYCLAKLHENGQWPE